MDSRRWWSSPAWRPASLLRRSAGPARFRCRSWTVPYRSRRKVQPDHVTCNTSRGSWARGSASTGGTTAAWWPARHLAREVNCSERPAGTDTVVDTSGLQSRINSLNAGLILWLGPPSAAQSAKSTGYSAKLQPGYEPVPGVAIRVDASTNTGARNRERRSQSAAHRIAESVRCCGGRRQPVQRRTLQMESHAYRHQHG